MRQEGPKKSTQHRIHEILIWVICQRYQGVLVMPAELRLANGQALSNGSNLSGENYMICAHEICAYALSDKEWGMY